MRLALALTVACAAVVTGCAGASAPRAEGDALRAVMVGQPAAHAFVGEVVRARPAAWSGGAPGAGVVYTPVVLAVTDVLRGGDLGQQVVVRAYGGTVDGVASLTTLTRPAGTFDVGQRLVVVAYEPVRTPDGTAAMAPVEVLALSGSTARLAPVPDQLGTPASRASLPLDELAELLR